MKKLSVLLLLFISFYSKGQTLTSEESYRNYFVSHKDSIDPIEGIWSVSTTQEFYRYDTLYDVRKYPKAAKVAVMKKENKYYKVIIDTNVWISFLIGKQLKGLPRIIASGTIKVITCREQVAELSEVFRKPKIKK